MNATCKRLQRVAWWGAAQTATSQGDQNALDRNEAPLPLRCEGSPTGLPRRTTGQALPAAAAAVGALMVLVMEEAASRGQLRVAATLPSANMMDS